MRETMTEAEIHRLGVHIVREELQHEGWIVLTINVNPKVNPQIIARKNGTLGHVLVRTARHPNRGAVENDHIVPIYHHIRAAHAAAAQQQVATTGILGSPRPGRLADARRDDVSAPARLIFAGVVIELGFRNYLDAWQREATAISQTANRYLLADRELFQQDFYVVFERQVHGVRYIRWLVSDGHPETAALPVRFYDKRHRQVLRRRDHRQTAIRQLRFEGRRDQR